MGDPGLTARYEALRNLYFVDENGHVLPPGCDATVEWSSRLTSSAGVCYPKTRTIRLSTHYHATYPDEIDSTLLHEMIHLLVPGHGKPFREWMGRIQAKGGRVTRHSRERATPRGPDRWRYTCVRCGVSWERRRRLPHGGKSHVHKRCGGGLRESAIPVPPSAPSAPSESASPVASGSSAQRGAPSSPGPDAEPHSGLLWPGKQQAIREAYTPCGRRLVVHGAEAADRGASIPSTASTTPSASLPASGHLFIEGDNLDALKLLLPHYEGRVKMIYIDPPYNTGKQFAYSDRFRSPRTTRPPAPASIGANRRDGAPPQRAHRIHAHAAWLSMMAPRLLAARDLLRDDGVIVIHIDENEQHNLLQLMAELYGEEHHLGTIVWDKRNPKGDATGIAYQHELIVVYAKDRKACVAAAPLRRPKANAFRMLDKAAELFSRLGTEALPADLDRVAKKYRLPAAVVEPYRARYTLERVNDDFAAWVRSQEQLSGGEKAYSRIDSDGNVYRLVSMAWPNKQRPPDSHFTPLVHPVTGRPCPVPARGWRYAPETMRRLLEAGEIVFGPDEHTQPQRKYLLKENVTESIPSVLRFGGSDDAALRRLGIPFENPKPVRVAVELISYFANESGDIVLDFFAGSGTTGHAVLELNKVDGRARRFVLVQSAEPTPDRSPARAAGFATVADLTRARLEQVCARLDDRDTTHVPSFATMRVSDRGTD